jgi:hypothetical protein
MTLFLWFLGMPQLSSGDLPSTSLVTNPMPLGGAVASLVAPGQP